jgi:hypothetical protein
MEGLGDEKKEKRDVQARGKGERGRVSEFFLR